MLSANYRYIGTELSVFAKALNWKHYLRSQIAPYVRGRVAEVGAGMGATTAVLCSRECSEWLALEPDAEFAREIKAVDKTNVFIGTLADLPPQRQFDAVLYIDVLEHIENDVAELQRAADHLSPGGHLVVLGPAHNLLFTEFDRHIGHFRRYNKRILKEIAPPALILRRLRYLDSVGFFASLANRCLLKQATPSEGQIMFWDRILVPLSILVDPLSGYLFGKSILGVWHKPA